MATECEWKAYSQLASVTIVYHQSVVSVDFSLTSISPQHNCATSSTSFATNQALALLYSLDRTDRNSLKTGPHTRCSFLTTRPKVVEEAEMTEKPLNHDVEQADSDLTITIPNHRPSTLLAKLASLPSSASLSQSSKFCPTASTNHTNLCSGTNVGIDV